MKLDFHLVHDGDFCIDIEYFKQLQEDKVNFIDYKYSSDGYCIDFVAKIKQQEGRSKEILAQDVIGAFIKSVRFNHMFIMKDLWETYRVLWTWIFTKKKEKKFTYCWTGNYDGTEWTIVR